MSRVLERVSGGVAASFDRAFNNLALARRGPHSRSRSRSESLGPVERERALEALRQAYDDPRFFSEPDTFFIPPPAAEVALEPVRRASDGGRVVDLTWPSDYAPFHPEVAERYLRTEANRVAHARALLHSDRPRPAIILIHGYMGGAHRIEERAWPVEWLYGLGLDVILAVLPFHGPRGRGGLHRPAFPGSDPRMTIEGFRHAVFDLRSLVDWLVGRGAPAVGVMGMSLGGYTTALLATVEPRLTFAVPFIPLASIADFARAGGRLVGTASQQARQQELLEAVHAVVSPLSRPPLVPPEGRLVVAGRADRITPIAHAERIAAHWGAPLEAFYGGHLLQLGRGRGFRALARMLGRLGLLES